MTIYPPLEIPETLAAGPGPGNNHPRVLERFVKTGVGYALTACTQTPIAKADLDALPTSVIGGKADMARTCHAAIC